MNTRTKTAVERAPVRVLVADDDPLVRAAVGALLSPNGDYEMVGEATDGDETIAQADRLRPEILLLDLNMPRKPGLDALREMGDRIAGMKTIVLTVAIEKKQILEVLQLGARGIVLKSEARNVLADSIRAVIEGYYWVDNQPVLDVKHILEDLMTVPVHESDRAVKRHLLSAKEMQIVSYIVEGRTNRDIATSMQTSEQVVKNHLGKIFDKLGVFNRLELALYALDHRIAQRN